MLLEAYPIELVNGAKLLFMAFQGEKAVDLKGTTKTAFAYEGF